MIGYIVTRDDTGEAAGSSTTNWTLDPARVTVFAVEQQAQAYARRSRTTAGSHTRVRTITTGAKR